jgi:hypothetical protein
MSPAKDITKAYVFFNKEEYIHPISWIITYPDQFQYAQDDNGMH